MRSGPFDLATAFGSYGAAVLCVRCGGMLAEVQPTCPLCANVLLERSSDPAQLEADFARLDQRLDRYNCRLRVAAGDGVTPLRDWAQIERLFHAARFLHGASQPAAQPRPRPQPEHTAMGRYMQLLGTAQQFIHFSSVGISDLFLGFLKALSFKSGVSLRGIVSGVTDPAAVEQLTSAADSPDLEIHVIQPAPGRPNPPELLILDGLVALRGQAMLHPAAWRNLLRDRASLDLLTDSAAIIELNNRTFAPLFGASSLIRGWNVTEARRDMVGRTWSA